MKRTPSLFFVLLTSLLVFLVTGQGLASSFVLCIGESGSTAIEQAVSGKCAPIESTSCTAGELSTHDHCGPCQDTSIGLDFAHGRHHGDYDLSLPVLPPVLVSIAPPGFFQDLTTNLLAQPPPRPYHALSALRTIVLLN